MKHDYRKMHSYGLDAYSVSFGILMAVLFFIAMLNYMM